MAQKRQSEEEFPPAKRADIESTRTTWIDLMGVWHRGNVSWFSLIPLDVARLIASLCGCVYAEEVYVRIRDAADAVMADGAVETRLEAIHDLQALLSMKNPPITEVIVTGVVPRLVAFIEPFDDLVRQLKPNPLVREVPADITDEYITFLGSGRNTVLQLTAEAAWVLQQVTADTAEQTDAVINAGAVPKLIAMVESKTDDICEHSLLTLNNIAATSTVHRDLVLSLGLLVLLCRCALQNRSLGLVRARVRTLATLCHGTLRCESNVIALILDVFKMLVLGDDHEIVEQACWGMAFLVHSAAPGPGAVVDSSVVDRLVSLMTEPTSVRRGALHAIGCIAYGNSTETQKIIDSAALPVLQRLMGASYPPRIRQDACWTISNILAGPPCQQSAVIERGIIQQLIVMLRDEPLLPVKKEVAWGLLRLATSADHKALLDVPEMLVLIPKSGSQDMIDALMRVADHGYDKAKEFATL